MTLNARMKNIALLVPEALKALIALHATTVEAGVDARTLGLVELRASQINGCSVCVDIHIRELLKGDFSKDRVLMTAAVAAWRDAPYFSEAERAALALTEAVTRLSDRTDPVPDEVWDEAARHYNERALAALVIAIANINAWNRLNVSTRQVAGAWTA